MSGSHQGEGKAGSGQSRANECFGAPHSSSSHVDVAVGGAAEEREAEGAAVQRGDEGVVRFPKRFRCHAAGGAGVGGGCGSGRSRGGTDGGNADVNRWSAAVCTALRPSLRTALRQSMPGGRTWPARAPNRPHHQRSAVGRAAGLCIAHRCAAALQRRQTELHLTAASARVPSIAAQPPARPPASAPPKGCSEVMDKQCCPAILLAALCGMGQRPLGACTDAAAGRAQPSS